jgi:hypothetical protein
MFEIEYIGKNSTTPNGQVIGRIFEESSWIYDEHEFPFIFEVIVSGKSVWEKNLYPNTWASWHILDNDDFVAIIKNKKGEIISKFVLDIWTNRNATEQFFDIWISKNLNSNGMVIGTHDGTSGEWVNHVKNNSTNAVLVEASKKQFKELNKNYFNFNNVKFRNEVVTGNGGYVKFYEFGEGFANTVSKDHYQIHTSYDENVNIIDINSVGINELILQENLQCNLDWIHLDTESIDDEIIMSLDFNKINKPKLIVFETINFSEERTGNRDRIDKLFNWLNNHGYKVKYDYWNSFAYLTT